MTQEYNKNINKTETVNVSVSVSGNTILSNEFIDLYMTTSNHTYVVIYILALRMSELGNVNSKEIAKQLKLLESDVINAFIYWEEKKLLKISSLNEKTLAVFSKNNMIKQDEVVNLIEKPTYSIIKIEEHRQNDHELRDLFTFAQTEFGGDLFDYNEINTLFGLYEWLKLPIDVIKYLISYAVLNNSKNMNYIEKVAIDWSEHNIKTVDDAQKYLKSLNNSVYTTVLKACGIFDPPAKIQIEFIDKWINEYKMDLEVILHCVDYSIILKNKTNFPYIDSILKAWHEKGLKTVDEIKKSTEEFRTVKQNSIKASGNNTKASAKSPYVKKEKHKNFGERKIDNNELKNLEKMYIEKMLKKS